MSPSWWTTVVSARTERLPLITYEGESEHMGQKVHPIGFRVGVYRNWEAKWFAEGKEYTDLLAEDLDIRALIETRHPTAGISRIEIERSVNEVNVTIHTAKPGIVIGRQGSAVEETRRLLERLTLKKVRVNIMEIRTPELEARLVARNVAEQLEKRVSFRRVLKQTIQRTMRMGAQGIRIGIGGRLGGADMARRLTEIEGKVPLHTLRADIDYGRAEALTTAGRVGVKVWIYRGDKLLEGRSDMDYDDTWELRRDRLRERERARAAAQRRREAAQPAAAAASREAAPPTGATETAADEAEAEAE